MKRFGPWPSDFPEIPTPVGKRCVQCGNLLTDGDSGVIVPASGIVSQRAGESPDDYIVRAAEAVMEQPWHIACIVQALTGRRWAGSFPRSR